MSNDKPAASADELQEIRGEVEHYLEGTKHGREDFALDADVVLARAEEKCTQGGELRLADVQRLRLAIASLR